MESWDDDNFEPAVIAPVVPNVNKWEGEDEEDDVKESWDDEEEERPKEDLLETKPKPKKQTLQEKIAEKEKQKREEMERRLKEQEEELTPEEKLRRQQESDLNAALETTFVDTTGTTILELNLPNTKEEFQEFADNLSKKLLQLSKNPEYLTFMENLLRNLCATLPSLDIKKIKNSLDNLYLEKQKIEKGEKSKKNKGKGKAKLKLDDNDPLSTYVNDYDDFDDFM